MGGSGGGLAPIRNRKVMSVKNQAKRGLLASLSKKKFVNDNSRKLQGACFHDRVTERNMREPTLFCVPALLPRSQCMYGMSSHTAGGRFKCVEPTSLCQLSAFVIWSKFASILLIHLVWVLSPSKGAVDGSTTS